MNKFSFHNQSQKLTSKPANQLSLPVLQKLKEAYLFWYQNYTILPKTHRYSLGEKIDKLFVDAIEATTAASFLSQAEKISYVRFAIKKMDTLKIFLMILWETKSFDDKRYIALSLKLNEVGKMLGGWLGQLLKQNSPKK